MKIQKKICMLGAFAVGKTSLVRRFVYTRFDEKYHSTIGVKIDRCVIDLRDTSVHLMVWDIAGEEEYSKVPMSYVRGAAGYFLVVDGTRLATVETALDLQARVTSTIGDVPFSFVLNKADLETDWELPADTIESLRSSRTVFVSSAKTGDGVTEAFWDLATRMVGRDNRRDKDAK